MKARVVIGANFGDEGKGLVTDYLCAQGAGVVVRFNGGAQAGHTVITPERERHVFHHFGSGTFCEVPTFLSQFFVCNPILFFEELKQLQDLGFRPEVYAHPECLITTFMDMLINQHKETDRGSKRHGSCGVGFHETIVRSKVPELKITIGDLWNGVNIQGVADELCGKYSKFRTGKTFDDSRAVKAFLECCESFAQYVQPAGIGSFIDPVFEGAQGLLLDQNRKEFFPHVTHSNTGMENVNILCAQAGIKEKEIYYVSRTYLTRHGAGPLPGEDRELQYEDETNMPNTFQGSIRFAPLFENGLRGRCSEDCKQEYKLVLTHCDQLSPSFEADLYSEGPSRADVTQELNATITV